MSANEALNNIGEKKKYDADTMVFMQNDPGESMYIVLAGSFGVYVNTYTDETLKISKITPGSFFGEMSILDGSKRSATIVAEEKSIVLEIKPHEFPQFLIQNPKAIPSMLTTLIQRIKLASEKLENMGRTVTPSISVENTLNNGERLVTVLLKKEPNKIIETLEELSKYLRELNDAVSNKTVITNIPNWTEYDDIKHSTLLPEEHATYGVTERPSNINYVGKKNVVCPVCEHHFITTMPVVSKLLDDKPTRDLRPAFKNFDFLWYGTCVCPKCNYADFYNTFADLDKDRAAALRERNYEGKYPPFSGFSNPRTVDEVMESYYLLLKCYAMITNDPFPKAKAYIRLYWLYSDLNDTENATTAAIWALTHYEETLAHDQSSYSAAELLQIRTTTAELALYLKQNDKAVQYYSKNLETDPRLRPNLTEQARNVLTEINPC